MYPDDFLQNRLLERKAENAFRTLVYSEQRIDFCSNDYLGIAQTSWPANQPLRNGSGGSRLLAGNYPLINETEQLIASFHEAEAGLIYNSGYDANIGLISSVVKRDDTILYDRLSHASIRDGIVLSRANAFSFQHNDVADLERKLQQATGNCFIITESLFSMDGDTADLTSVVLLAEKYNAHLIIDEAHATGIIGNKGEGLTQSLGLQHRVFARIHTFGKAVGCHGAVVLGSNRLRDYLINFSRSLMYTTSLPPSAIEAIKYSYQLFPTMHAERNHIQLLVNFFQTASLPYEKLPSSTPIQGVIVPGNDAVKKLAQMIQEGGIDVRPILYPTVPKGAERLRIVLHAFNTINELEQLCRMLTN